MTASTSNGILVPTTALSDQQQTDCATIAAELRDGFQAEFSIWDGDAGKLLLSGQLAWRLGDLIQEELEQAVARKRKAEFIADADGVVGG